MTYLAVLALLAAAATQDAAPQPAAPAAQAAAPAKAKKICRSEVDTGSIMPKRTCHTQAEWDALSGANRGTYQDLKSQQLINQTVQGAH